MSKALAKLTSISTSTLSLLLQLQRHHPSPAVASSPLTEQIKANLVQLRAGIGALEKEDDGANEALGLLKNQYERMRSMLVPFGVRDVPSITEPIDTDEDKDSEDDELHQQQSLQPKSKSSSTDVLYTPYKDDPEAGRPFLDDPQHDQDPHELLQTQRQLMDDQDTHLDLLSHSISRQHSLSLQINSELDEHHQLLEELDTDIDRSHNRLGNARKRLGRVAEGLKKNGSTVAIASLIVILLILILVFKT